MQKMHTRHAKEEQALNDRHARARMVAGYLPQITGYLASIDSDGPLQPIPIGRTTKLIEFAEPMQAAADWLGEAILTTHGPNHEWQYAFVPGGYVEDYYEALDAFTWPSPAELEAQAAAQL